MNNLPFFRRYKPSPWNIVTMSLYTILSVGMLYYYAYAEFPKADYLFIYGFGTHLFLYCYQYKALRNFNIYLFWFAVSIIQLAFYLRLKDEKSFFSPAGLSSAQPLRNTIILIILFQLLRYVSIQTQRKELVCPERSGNDFYDNRKPTRIDYLCLIIYFSVWGLLIAI